MSGHSKWKQIKHKKGVTDKKRSQLFTKLLSAIRIAAKNETNPDFNPRLRTTIEKAKEAHIPQDNIDRILKQGDFKNLEDVIIEAYGPAGSALIIEAITDNKNRTVREIRNILNENGAKFASPHSVRWIFETPTAYGTDLPAGKVGWQPKFKQSLSDKDRDDLRGLIEVIEDHDDVQKITTNGSTSSPQNT